MEINVNKKGVDLYMKCRRDKKRKRREALSFWSNYIESVNID